MIRNVGWLGQVGKRLFSSMRLCKSTVEPPSNAQSLARKTRRFGPVLRPSSANRCTETRTRRPLHGCGMINAGGSRCRKRGLELVHILCLCVSYSRKGVVYLVCAIPDPSDDLWRILLDVKRANADNGVSETQSLPTRWAPSAAPHVRGGNTL